MSYGMPRKDPCPKCGGRVWLYPKWNDDETDIIATHHHCKNLSCPYFKTEVLQNKKMDPAQMHSALNDPNFQEPDEYTPVPQPKLEKGEQRFYALTPGTGDSWVKDQYLNPHPKQAEFFHLPLNSDDLPQMLVTQQSIPQKFAAFTTRSNQTVDIRLDLIESILEEHDFATDDVYCVLMVNNVRYLVVESRETILEMLGQ